MMIQIRRSQQVLIIIVKVGGLTVTLQIPIIDGLSRQRVTNTGYSATSPSSTRISNRA
jgi:hypothetical protein